jgi:hypothetical protein
MNLKKLFEKHARKFVETNEYYNGFGSKYFYEAALTFTQFQSAVEEMKKEEVYGNCNHFVTWDGSGGQGNCKFMTVQLSGGTSHCFAFSKIQVDENNSEKGE